MDKRLRKVFEHGITNYEMSHEEGAMDGFKFAIQRIRENKFYGFYGHFLADWLEKHLSQEVTSDRSKDK